VTARTSHLTRVRTQIRVHAHRRVQGLLEGEYASLRPGRSTDFTDLRAYVRGDDVKDVDWKASARARSLLIRRYAAVRRLTVVLVVSTGRRMAALNDVEVAKGDLAVTVAGILGHLATKHGDLVAAVWGDADGCRSLPPRGGEAHLERCLGDVHDAIGPRAAAADLLGVLRYVVRSMRRRTVVVVISDEDEIDDELAAVLRRLVAQHEVLWIGIGDLPLARAGAEGAPYRDVDSGAVLPAWLRADPVLLAEHAGHLAGLQAAAARRLDRLGIVHEQVHDHADAVLAVLRLLERHARARRR
jgi:uncharacterized protein (DUF58 family)